MQVRDAVSEPNVARYEKKKRRPEKITWAAG